MAIALLLIAQFLVGCSSGGTSNRAGDLQQRTDDRATAVALAAVTDNNLEPLSLDDVQLTWQIEDEEDASDEGASYHVTKYTRDLASTHTGTGLYKAMIMVFTADKGLPKQLDEVRLRGFLESYIETSRGLVDIRSAGNVRGPAVGRNYWWSGIQYRSEGELWQLYGVTFVSGNSVAVVATVAQQTKARLPDTYSLARDVAAQLDRSVAPSAPRQRSTGV
jgi:hypothetical protein